MGRAERRILEAAVRSVTFHHQVLYEIVRQSDGLVEKEGDYGDHHAVDGRVEAAIKMPASAGEAGSV